jgi:hypothetical protein
MMELNHPGLLYESSASAALPMRDNLFLASILAAYADSAELYQVNEVTPTNLPKQIVNIQNTSFFSQKAFVAESILQKLRFRSA